MSFDESVSLQKVFCAKLCRGCIQTWPEGGAVWISDDTGGVEGDVSVVGVLGVCHSRTGWFLVALNVYFSRKLRPGGGATGPNEFMAKPGL